MKKILIMIVFIARLNFNITDTEYKKNENALLNLEKDCRNFYKGIINKLKRENKDNEDKIDQIVYSCMKGAMFRFTRYPDDLLDEYIERKEKKAESKKTNLDVLIEKVFIYRLLFI